MTSHIGRKLGVQVKKLKKMRLNERKHLGSAWNCSFYEFYLLATLHKLGGILDKDYIFSSPARVQNVPPLPTCDVKIGEKIGKKSEYFRKKIIYFEEGR